MILWEHCFCSFSKSALLFWWAALQPGIRAVIDAPFVTVWAMLAVLGRVLPRCGPSDQTTPAGGMAMGNLNCDVARKPSSRALHQHATATLQICDPLRHLEYLSPH